MNNRWADVEIKLVTDNNALSACLKLRRQVFVDEQGVSYSEERDGLDDQCSHVLATDAGHVVGTARFRYTGDCAKIQRVCVPRTHRGRGFGGDLISFIIAHVRSEGRVGFVRLGSQVQARAFYENLGFDVYGDEYIDAGIAHRDMQLKL